MRRVNIAMMVAAALLLAIPASGIMVALWQSLGRTAPEAAAPALSIASATQAFDSFVATKIALRGKMIRLRDDIRNVLSQASPRVVWGADGWLFLTDNDVFSQITGTRLDSDAVARTAIVAARLARESAENGRAFVSVVAPNSHTIYRDKLPAWARPKPPTTELDLLLAALAARDVNTVDLRPVLLSEAATRPVYWRGDTHWSPYGATLAFNEIVRAVGRRDQAIDVEAAFGPEETTDRPGDMVKILGLQGPWPERMLPPVDKAMFSMGRFDRELVEKLGIHEFFKLRHRKPPADLAARPRVLVIGDSFAELWFPPLFMRFASEYMWMHTRFGAIELATVRAFDPDIVVFETVERSIVNFSDGVKD